MLTSHAVMRVRLTFWLSESRGWADDPEELQCPTENRAFLASAGHGDAGGDGMRYSLAGNDPEELRCPTKIRVLLSSRTKEEKRKMMKRLLGDYARPNFGNTGYVMVGLPLL